MPVCSDFFVCVSQPVMSKSCYSVQKRARLGIDASRDELLGDDTHDSEDQVGVSGMCWSSEVVTANDCFAVIIP